jgi:hypothetical protein
VQQKRERIGSYEAKKFEVAPNRSSGSEINEAHSQKRDKNNDEIPNPKCWLQKARRAKRVAV